MGRGIGISACRFGEAERINIRQRRPAFSYSNDEKLQRLLDDYQVRWELLSPSDRIDAESAWRDVYSDAFASQSRYRQGSKAEYEYLAEHSNHYLIIPFSSPVAGLPLSADVGRDRVSAYECRGALVSLSEFHHIEVFVSPMSFAWSMIYTHEDYAYGGPFFVRSEWVSVLMK